MCSLLGKDYESSRALMPSPGDRSQDPQKLGLLFRRRPTARRPPPPVRAGGPHLNWPVPRPPRARALGPASPCAPHLALPRLPLPTLLPPQAAVSEGMNPPQARRPPSASLGESPAAAPTARRSGRQRRGGQSGRPSLPAASALTREHPVQQRRQQPGSGRGRSDPDWGADGRAGRPPGSGR